MPGAQRSTPRRPAPTSAQVRTRFDEGSDIQRLKNAGIEVRTDRTPAHMHHKFAIFDRQTLLTGSYNWTRSAAEHNHENVVVTADARLTEAFDEAFERIWIHLE